MFNVSVICYYLCCLACMIYLFYIKRQDRLLIAVLLITLPGIGVILLFFLLRDQAEMRPEQKGKEPALSMSPLSPIAAAKDDEQLNVVSIQDALLLNDHETRRKLMIHSLKENTVMNTKLLKQALHNDDTETSHYAAAAIMEMNRKLLNKIQALYSELTRQPENPAVKQSYANTIKQYMYSGFIDQESYNRYLTKWSAVLAEILNHEGNGEDLVPFYVDKINCELERHEYDVARHYSKLFLKQFPQHEQAYITVIKLYYTLNNEEELMHVISQLKKQPIHLSAASLRLIRHWA